MNTLDRLTMLAERLNRETADCGYTEIEEAARLLPALIPLLREFAAAWADNSPRSDIRRVVARRILVEHLGPLAALRSNPSDPEREP